MMTKSPAATVVAVVAVLCILFTVIIVNYAYAPSTRSVRSLERFEEDGASKKQNDIIFEADDLVMSDVTGATAAEKSQFLSDSLADTAIPNVKSDNTLEMDARDSIFESDVNVAEEVIVMDGGDIVNNDGVSFSDEADTVIKNEQKITDIEGQLVGLVNELSTI